MRKTEEVEEGDGRRGDVGPTSGRSVNFRTEFQATRTDRGVEARFKNRTRFWTKTVKIR
jgi:hypothetical protein